MDHQSPHDLRWESLKTMIPGPHVSGKKVIVGHSSQKTGKILDLGHLACIDTYCYASGWLTGARRLLEQGVASEQTRRASSVPISQAARLTPSTT